MDKQTSKVKINSVIIKTSSGFEYYEYDEIVRFEANGNYTMVHIINIPKPIIAMCNLAGIERGYPNMNYYRCHKSHIVNLKHVKKFFTASKVLLMEDNIQVPVSEKCLKEIREMSKVEF